MTAPKTLPEGLLEFARTEVERAAIRSVERHGSVCAAARAEGTVPSAIREAIQRAERRRAAVDPELHAQGAPAGYHLRGVSTFGKVTLPDGREVSQWVKTNRDREEQLEALREALAEIVEPYRGAIEPAEPPQETEAPLLNVYPLGDAHIGMLAWARETGQDWDVKIAEPTIIATLDSVLRAAPDAQRGLVIILGDWFHRPDSSNRTPRSGNILDADSRHGKMLEIGLRTARRCIDSAARKHALTDVWVCPGNHDEDVALMLSIALKALYEAEPRVRVNAEPDPYKYLEFGASLIGSTHGHLAKPAKLPGVMAARQAEAWGRTRFRCWYLGHVHNETAKEYPGVIIETKRAIAPKDAYAHGAGYESDRDITCDTWHATEGRIGRVWRRVGGGL